MKPIDFHNALLRCALCPRTCGVNRAAGERGFCQAGKEMKLYRYAPHLGEEPPISGRRGSGTIFFSHCTLGCVYCQNYRWSQAGAGVATTPESLAAVLRKLRDYGCHNWNLVSPTPWLPMIRDALEAVKQDGRLIPVVYNTSGYERVETLRALEGRVDVYLADLRYASEITARTASATGNYVKKARAALLEMWRQAGRLELAPDGTALSGVICRILILPGLANEACENIRWLAANIGAELSLSLMAQYTPAYRAVNLETWNRKIDYREYRQVCRAIEKSGFSNGWIQDFDGQAEKELVGFNMPATEIMPAQGGRR